MGKRILMIDDDLELTELVREFLGQQGIELTGAPDPDAGVALLRQTRPDLVLLDVMLPHRNGFEVCREIRRTHTVPIVMLTARGAVSDRVLGLELGADDYLPKPFEARELLARIQTVWRRGHLLPTDETLTFEDLVIDAATRGVTLRGAPVSLTTAEYEVLSLFARHPGQVLSRDQVSERLKGSGTEVFSRSVDIIVSRVRQKLGDDPKHPRFFKTVWGTGYLFVAARKTA